MNLVTETLRSARNAVLSGQPIPATTAALLETWGYDVATLELRWKYERS